MKPPIALLSIPHTGTRHFLELLKEMGYEINPKHNMAYPNACYHMHLTHMRNEANDAQDISNIFPTLVPMRPQNDVVASWMSRGKPLEDLKTAQNNMGRIFSTQKQLFIPLGADDVGQYLDRIWIELGIALSPDRYEPRGYPPAEDIDVFSGTSEHFRNLHRELYGSP